MDKRGTLVQEGDLEAETEMVEAQKTHQIQEEMVERRGRAAEAEGLAGLLELHLHKPKAHLVDQEWLLLDYLAMLAYQFHLELTRFQLVLDLRMIKLRDLQ
jgi:UDP-2,3-diacylglucosamine pyrophosphatase LpxH